MAMTREKDVLLMYKKRMKMTLDFKQMDVISWVPNPYSVCDKNKVDCVAVIHGGYYLSIHG